jgi:hypothetical protein
MDFFIYFFYKYKINRSYLIVRRAHDLTLASPSLNSRRCYVHPTDPHAHGNILLLPLLLHHASGTIQTPSRFTTIFNRIKIFN